MQYQTLRSLAISLAIVLATTKSANGFSIRTDGDLTKDLEVGASSLEETRYKNAPNNAKQLKGETDDRVLNVVDSEHKASNLHDADDTLTKTTKVKESNTTEISKHEKDNNTMETSSSKIEIASVNKNIFKTINEILTSAPITAKQDSVNKSNNIIRNSAKKITNTTVTENIPTIINTSPNPTTSAQKSPITIFGGDKHAYSSLYTTTSENPIQNKNRNELTTTENTPNTTRILNSINTTQKQNITNANRTQDTSSLKQGINNDTSKEVTSKASKETESTTVLSSIESKNNIDFEVLKTPSVHPNIVSTLVNYETTTKYTNNGDDIATDDPIQTTQAVTYESKTNLENDSLTTTDSQTTETIDTDTIQNESTSGSTPHWKKYKTINRKRPAATSTEETTSLDLEMTRAETARIALADLFSNTPIPSLEDHKTGLLNPKEYTTRKPVEKTTDMVETTSIVDTSDTMLTQSVSDEVTIETPTRKLGIVSSLRAGYIDNSETTTRTTEKAQITATYEEKALSNDSIDKEDLGAFYETDAGDGEMELPEPKNATRVESQSQLVEDAIKEELLMEKTISDNELLKIRHRQVEGPPATIPTSIEMVTEDILRVKPIGAEKRAMLYVVSPNYKPLKKLDVQPSKQFLRNPDDNSWRNESISSLGIVFKPKNASKSFTEVLKNKTTELANLSGKSDKNYLPDLRVRLGKIAEVRKSKKKRINKYGDTVYSDYEENSVENSKSSKEDVTSPIIPLKLQESDRATITTTPSTTTLPPPNILKIEDYLPVSKEKVNALRDKLVTPSTSSVKSRYHLRDYDTSEDYYADYTLPKIDLKKFTVPLRHKDVVATRPPGLYPTLPLDLTNTKPMRVTYMPDRQPTIQYFPPTKKNIAHTTRKEIPVKVNVNDYDEEFKNKVSLYTNKEAPKTVFEVSFGTASPMQTKPFELPSRQIPDKNLYITNSQQVTEPIGSFAANDGSFNRASYVIKHYKDFIDDASKSDEDLRPPGYLTYTESPLQGVTMSDVAKFSASKEDLNTNKNKDAVIDYDFDTQFRKDVLNRFVDNFNQNSEKFKVDFPILYNNSVVHRKVDENGKVLASSTAFLKRMYDSVSTRPNFIANVKPCDPNCDPMTVDLSPAYELHYYVPDQEEKEEIEHRPHAVPYRFRL